MIKPNWFHVLLLLFFAGLVKGSLHIVKVVIIAGLGLAGMWMLHTLAQDYDKISNKFMGLRSFIGKRSVDSPTINIVDVPGFPQLKWETILSQDPEGCVPSYICQLAAIPEEKLPHSERSVLNLIRATSEKKNSRGSKTVRQALKLGEKIPSAHQCRKHYPKCPYTSDTMLSLIRTYGER